MKSESNPCVTRLLTIITLFLGVQTVSMSIIIYSIYSIYDTHRHDLNAIGAVPWGEMANKLKSHYMSMDMNTINNIIDNSNNLTLKANLMMHTQADEMMTNFHSLSKKASKNSDMIDMTRNIIYRINQPVENVRSLLNNDNTGDIKDTIKLAKDISKKIDRLKLNELINTFIDLSKKFIDSMTPEMLKELSSIVHKIDGLMNNHNNKLVHDLAEDADHTVQSVNKLFDIFKNINKK